MINKLLLALVFLLVGANMAQAGTVTEAFQSLRTCVMANDTKACRALLTPRSHELFDRFASYKLFSCLPTNFTAQKEQLSGESTILTATMPAGGDQHYVLKLVYRNLHLDVPASLQLGLGAKWQERVRLAEQLYLMMRANLGNALTCDKLEPLLQ